jgi:ABC-type dipeptide/oligopeptide/nickel transport system permease component
MTVRYILNRLGQGLMTLLVLATVVFLVARTIGNPVDAMLPPDATPADRAYMIERLGLDRPLYVQYFEFMAGLVQGDLGQSLRFNAPVAELFFERFPNTVMLAGVAFVFALSVGIVLGVISATHRGGMVDQAARLLSVLGMSAPSFWVGLMLILFFSVYLRVLPVAQMAGPSSFVLPAFTLSLFFLAGTTRLVRSSMIETLDSEYVRLAKIKGLPHRVVIWKHALRNALIPVLTFAGVNLANMLNGSVVIESVFAWPGVGRLIYQSIVGRDYPLVQGCVLLVGFIIVIISVVVDILYCYVDPRIRLATAK